MLRGTFGQKRVVITCSYKKRRTKRGCRLNLFLCNNTFVKLVTYVRFCQRSWLIFLEEDLKWHPQGVILMNRCRGIRLVLKTDWFCFHFWSLWSTCKKKRKQTDKKMESRTVKPHQSIVSTDLTRKCRESSTFFKGIAAGNQNLKADFLRKTKPFFYHQVKTIPLLLSVWNVGQTEVKRSKRPERYLVWLVSVNFPRQEVQRERQSNQLQQCTHTQHFVISIYDFRHEYTLMSSKTDQWTGKSSCRPHKLWSQT